MMSHSGAARERRHSRELQSLYDLYYLRFSPEVIMDLTEEE